MDDGGNDPEGKAPEVVDKTADKKTTKKIVNYRKGGAIITEYSDNSYDISIGPTEDATVPTGSGNKTASYGAILSGLSQHARSQLNELLFL